MGTTREDTTIVAGRAKRIKRTKENDNVLVKRGGDKRGQR